MTAPAGVDWPAVYARLCSVVRFADSDLATVRWRVAHRSALLGERHMALACMSFIGERTLTDVCDMPAEAARWLTQAAAVAYRAVVHTPTPVTIADDITPGVDLDDTLAGGVAWPHRTLAEQWATANRRRVVVAADDTPRPGAHAVTDTAGRAIVVRLARHDSLTELHATWRHELAHLLDPSPARTEEFADTLAALLAEHDPADLDALAPLVDQATEACPVAASAPDTDDAFGYALALLLDFAALPLAPPGQMSVSTDSPATPRQGSRVAAQIENFGGRSG